VTSSRATLAVFLLLLGTSLWAADRNVSIASLPVGPGKPWQWTIFIKGNPDALAHIKCVQYLLDSSFPNPSRTVCDQGAEDRPFSSSGTTWGPFELSATVTFDDGTLQQFQYHFPQAEIYYRSGWYPTDLAFNPDSGLFVLDRDGSISRVVSDASGIQLATLPVGISLSYQPEALAASKDSVFVSANSSIGCTIFRYSFANKKTTKQFLQTGGVGQGGCEGIATDGTGIFLVIPGKREIWYWPDFNSSSYKTLNPPVPLNDSTSGSLNFNGACQCLIFAGASGTAYVFSLQEGKWSTVTDKLGYVHSIASDSSHILFASGKNVLFYSRTSKRRENAPTSMQLLTGGLITGVAIDSTGSAWIADFDKGIVKGPVPLN